MEQIKNIKTTLTYCSEIAELSKTLVNIPKGIFLCDENTYEKCFKRLRINTSVIVIPFGEKHKTIETCSLIWSELMEKNAKRDAHLICLGGGVITDIGAFVASTYLRGINYTLVPTSLLAMIDASVGGKNGVDFNHIKNSIGLFNDNYSTIICSSFLSTLNSSELQNGITEMLKHGLIADKNHFLKVLPYYKNKLQPSDELIKKSIAIKLDHCKNDLRDSGKRNRLNFGHNIGHALESYFLSKDKLLPHGAAVGIGIIAEARLSSIYTNFNTEGLALIIDLFTPLIKEYKVDAIQASSLLPFLKVDKKNKGTKLIFCLLHSIGVAKEGYEIKMEDIITVLQKIGMQ